MSLFNYWPAALLLIGCTAFGYENPDSPVSDEGNQVTGIQEGVAGRVTDGDGHPVEGALIQPRSLDSPSPPIPDIAILSGEDGRYDWPLPPGTYEMSASADGYHVATKRAIFNTGQVVRVDFRLEKTQ